MNNQEDNYNFQKVYLTLCLLKFLLKSLLNSLKMTLMQSNHCLNLLFNFICIYFNSFFCYILRFCVNFLWLFLLRYYFFRLLAILHLDFNFKLLDLTEFCLIRRLLFLFYRLSFLSLVFDIFRNFYCPFCPKSKIL